MPLSHDNNNTGFGNEYGRDVPDGFVEVWPLGLVRITDIKNGQLQEPDIPETPGWVQYCLGLDVAAGGRDRTALCIASITYDRRDEPHADVLYLKRLRKGIFFREISSQVKRIAEKLKEDGERRGLKVDLTVLIDSGGVGEGLAQGIIDAMQLFDCRAVYLTGGGYQTRTDGTASTFPKATWSPSSSVRLSEDGFTSPRNSKNSTLLKRK